MNDYAPNTNQEMNQETSNHMISFGSGLLVIAFFGLCKQFDYLTFANWSDGILVSVGSSITVASVLRRNLAEALIAILITLSVIVIKHDIFEFKQVFFIILILLAIRMIVSGIRSKT